MRIEVRHGRNSPQMVVILEEASNYNLKTHEWIPKTDEVSLIAETFGLLAKKEQTK